MPSPSRRPSVADPWSGGDKALRPGPDRDSDESGLNPPQRWTRIDATDPVRNKTGSSPGKPPMGLKGEGPVSLSVHPGASSADGCQIV